MWNFRRGIPAFATVGDFVPFMWVFKHPGELAGGLSFSLTLLAILLAHEFGHWLLCAYHRVVASWPYLLPAPTLSGTAGAVIRIRFGIPSLDALMDVGIAGPVAGCVVAIPATLVGLLLSKTAAGPVQPVLIQLNAPLAMRLLYAPMRLLAPSFPSLDNLLWHPVLIAAWVGLFVTSLNLIPAGQLDGGHVLYAISRRWHRWITIAVPGLLLIAGLTLWVGWLLWGVILLIPAMRHPYVAAYPELSGNRGRFGWLAVLMLVLTFLPAPFADAGLLGYLR
ncbi:putative metal-dependent hydrolase [Acidisarcina polymorpha]|uniref:Putative metal-dependent hydrolase n=2 Tax=Acidisarcina polymorpha TaxID=2211140 RepID=A0A2Z5FYZ8_9BACT|nr:putative metal-dependent hydrolase [Acidisarcina polymorpha]